ncbi:hypothetical protein J6590_017632 [Homalodisca vitripennis]|nr:hypothetical protein J6590_017632 [Homalodisca vitripennis]
MEFHGKYEPYTSTRSNVIMQYADTHAHRHRQDITGHANSYINRISNRQIHFLVRYKFPRKRLFCAFDKCSSAAHILKRHRKTALYGFMTDINFILPDLIGLCKDLMTQNKESRDSTGSLLLIKGANTDPKSDLLDRSTFSSSNKQLNII